jgi:predicted dehydrogenase/threonine dehydrogenase-like Zn-dependent dehydrogenase
MKQILQNLSNGETSLVETPCPKNTDGFVLIESRASVVSPGTERMLIEFGQANYLNKAKQQPDKVKQVLNKIKTDGILSTMDAVKTKLDQPIPLGYCNAGIILESSVKGFAAGDRVVSNGNHAEVVKVPKNLCAKIPDNVSDDEAAFTVLGSIALQGVRLLNPTLGESFVVSGLGMIGLITVQLLRASGCRVLGIDFDSQRCSIAREFGAETVDLSKSEDPIAKANIFSNGRGVDGVIIAASSNSEEIIHQAAQMTRKRGRIILVGVVNLNLRRDDFFEKEITFQVSASYGPGRYDPNYEEKGQDYPLGYVRWTEQRNFEAILELLSNKTLDFKRLISHRFVIEDAIDAYQSLKDKHTLGILIEYPEKSKVELDKDNISISEAELSGLSISDPRIGFIGAGNYASRTLIPAFKRSGAYLDTLVSIGGSSALHHGKKNGFDTVATDLSILLEETNINTLVIATRHNDHADQVVKGLRARKNIFVEKPLALSLKELDQINEEYIKINSSPDKDTVRLMIGFNRRFSPHIKKMKDLMDKKPDLKTVLMTVNAGRVPKEHWIHDPMIGGGMILGECCHFIDLARFMIGSPIVDFKVSNSIDLRIENETSMNSVINLMFEDGSLGVINYFTNGGNVFQKERIEVFSGDSALQMNNFRSLIGFGWDGFKRFRTLRQDKGQNNCVNSFIKSIEEGLPSPIQYDEIIETSKLSIEIANELSNPK